MKRYKNISGRSGVRGYDIARDSITVKFYGGATYLYDYAATGKNEVETMKTLAQGGEGLSTFISLHVRDNYTRRLR